MQRQHHSSSEGGKSNYNDLSALKSKEPQNQVLTTLRSTQNSQKVVVQRHSDSATSQRGIVHVNDKLCYTTQHLIAKYLSQRNENVFIKTA